MNSVAEKHILIVDDDARLRGLLSEYLSSQGFYVLTASDAAQAREKLEYIKVDALVLDRMMPGENGLELAASMRDDATPILMLTAMGETDERIEGLEAGVQDYLTKPFEPRELVLRLSNILARAQAEQTNHLSFGPYRFDANGRQLYHGEAPIHLTTAEALYLSVLIEEQGKPVSRERLAETIASAGESVSERSVDVQINRLRKKIELNPSRPVFIQTVRGEGYVLKRG